MYEYKCLTIRVIDGNTIDAEVDLGFNVLVRQRIKLHGVNTSDIRSTDESEKQRAHNARQRLTELVGKEFYCNTVMNKRGKVGRTLGYVHIFDENENRIDVNQTLIDEGLAIRYGE
jgi:micrococcal nuclease|tara:strand:- start:3129 stop:3476 length:348 start_codon:yes stop_codon:yes gene_type:complete